MYILCVLYFRYYDNISTMCLISVYNKEREITGTDQSW